MPFDYYDIYFSCLEKQRLHLTREVLTLFPIFTNSSLYGQTSGLGHRVLQEYPDWNPASGRVDSIIKQLNNR